MLAKVKLFAKAAPAGHWLTGGNWDHTLWASKTLPTRQDLDKVTGIIRRFSTASTATSPSPTPPRWKRPASPARPSRRRAEPSTWTQMANPPAFFASRPRDWSTRSFRRPATTNGGAATSWPSPTLFRTASPACRTSATGRIFSFSKSWKRKAISSSASRSGCHSKTRCGTDQNARSSRSERSDAAYRVPEGIHGWIAGLAHRRHEGAILRRSQVIPVCRNTRRRN